MNLDDIKTASPEDISEALLIWSNTIPDPDNNFDAQLLIRASEMIDDLQTLSMNMYLIDLQYSTIEKYNDKNSS